MAPGQSGALREGANPLVQRVLPLVDSTARVRFPLQQERRTSDQCRRRRERSSLPTTYGKARKTAPHEGGGKEETTRPGPISSGWSAPEAPNRPIVCERSSQLVRISPGPSHCHEESLALMSHRGAPCSCRRTELCPAPHLLTATIRGHVFCSFLHPSCPRKSYGNAEWTGVVRDMDSLTVTEQDHQGKRFLPGRASGTCGTTLARVALPPAVRLAPRPQR